MAYWLIVLSIILYFNFDKTSSNLDLLIGNDMQAVVIFAALVNLLADAVQFLAFGSREVGCVLLHLELHIIIYIGSRLLGVGLG